MGIMDGINGLLGDSIEDPRTQGLAAGIQGLLGGGSTMQRLASFVPNYSGVLAYARGRKLQEEELRQKMALQGAQIDETKAQALQRAAAVEEVRRKAAEAERRAQDQQTFLSNPFAAGAAPAPGGMPGAAQQQGGRQFDYARAVQLYGPEHASKLMEGFSNSQNFGRPKVARVEVVAGPNNEQWLQQFDERGDRVGSPIPKPVEMSLEDFGGTKRAVNKFSLQPGQSFSKTATPGELMSNSLGRDRLTFDRNKDARDGVAGQLVEGQNGYVRVGKDNSVTPLTMNGQPLMGKGANLTEDQGKATGWLVQAENAWKNMQAVGLGAPDETGKRPILSAAKPGFNDVLAKVPSMGLGAAIAQGFRGPDRQKYLQGASSLSESLLRAATGAGVNRDEAEQKVKELTPQVGDGDDLIEQKMASIPLYIESLKIRAGSTGASKAAAVSRGRVLTYNPATGKLE